MTLPEFKAYTRETAAECAAEAESHRARWHKMARFSFYWSIGFSAWGMIGFLGHPALWVNFLNSGVALLHLLAGVFEKRRGDYLYREFLNCRQGYLDAYDATASAIAAVNGLGIAAMEKLMEELGLQAEDGEGWKTGDNDTPDE